MSYFDIVWYWRLWKRWKINKELNVTQTEANLHYENHPMDLALRYVNVNKVILISAAMAPLIPHRSGVHLSSPCHPVLDRQVSLYQEIH